MGLVRQADGAIVERASSPPLGSLAMSRNACRSSAGFTLVEMLIVVVILAILAAVVIPSFTNASDKAKASTTLSQLRHVRDQVARYRFDHRDTWPDLVTHQWMPLLQKTDSDGNISDTARFGPYLVNPPLNPYTNSMTVGAASAANLGWVYDITNGHLDAVGFDEATGTFAMPQ